MERQPSVESAQQGSSEPARASSRTTGGGWSGSGKRSLRWGTPRAGASTAAQRGWMAAISDVSTPRSGNGPTAIKI